MLCQERCTAKVKVATTEVEMVSDPIILIPPQIKDTVKPDFEFFTRVYLNIVACNVFVATVRSKWRRKLTAIHMTPHNYERAMNDAMKENETKGFHSFISISLFAIEEK